MSVKRFKVKIYALYRPICGKNGLFLFLKGEKMEFLNAENNN